MVDSFSGWPEVMQVKDRSAESTIKALRSVFSRLGVPYTLVSDNAAEFGSEMLQDWLLKIGCKPYKTPPYHPQSNGLAERMVRTIKNGMKAWRPEFGLFTAHVQKLLLNYRAIPHGDRQKSSSELMGRQIRSPILCSFQFKPTEKVWYKEKTAEVITQKGKNTFIVTVER